MSAYSPFFSTINIIIILASVCAITINGESFADDSKATQKSKNLQLENRKKEKVGTNTRASNLDSSSPQSSLQAEEGLTITLYPQHERVSLIYSKRLIDFWPNFFGQLSTYLDETSKDKILKQFLSWKRTQDLFVSLKALEELKLSLSNHLLILEHGQAVKSDEIAYKEKLLSLLTRLELQSTHLAKDREWREQEQLLKNRLSPLNDLWHADESLKNVLDPLISELAIRLKSQNAELDRLDETLEQVEDKSQAQDDVPVAEQDDELDDQSGLKEQPSNNDQLNIRVSSGARGRTFIDYYQELKDKTLELESAYGALQIFYKALSNREERFKKCIESLERLTFDSSELLRSLPELRAENESQLRHVKLWMAYWTSRNQLERKYEGISIESLLSRSTSKQSTIKTKWNALLEVNQELQESYDFFSSKYIITLQSSKPPKISPNLSKSSYAQTKHAFDTAQSFLTFHQERASSLKKAIKKAKVTGKDQ